MKKIVRVLIALLFTAGCITTIAAQTAATGKEPLDIFIGGEIAEYPNVEWIKGEPVKQFDTNKIYIVELWATWCGPCVAAMPHLNELHQKFKDKNVVFVAQGVWEEDKKKILQFVEQKGEGLSYRVAFGGGHGSDFDKRWILPAGINGIPATFVIQGGKLVWQTSPDKLNEAVLQLLLDKKFTIEAAETLQVQTK
jgi:thiol-disulfide isomerase/thioredoxin